MIQRFERDPQYLPVHRCTGVRGTETTGNGRSRGFWRGASAAVLMGAGMLLGLFGLGLLARTAFEVVRLGWMAWGL